ncbi:MAG: ABC transporter permease, partial [Mycobacteriales bacterium]
MSPRAFVALVGSGFRRWSSYKQATFAAAFTNSAFGFLKCYVLLAVVHAQHRVGGYDAEQLVTYVWLGQGLLGVVTLWGWTELSDRVKSGDVAIDLLRPTDPLPAYYAADLGRAGHAALTRLIIPLCVGAVAFGLYVPHRPQTVGVLLVSIVAAVSISFAVRYLVNLTAFWVLDARGFIAAWMVCGNIATGLMVPL